MPVYPSFILALRTIPVFNFCVDLINKMKYPFFNFFVRFSQKRQHFIIPGCVICSLIFHGNT